MASLFNLPRNILNPRNGRLSTPLPTMKLLLLFLLLFLGSTNVTIATPTLNAIARGQNTSVSSPNALSSVRNRKLTTTAGTSNQDEIAEEREFVAPLKKLLAKIKDSVKAWNLRRKWRWWRFVGEVKNAENEFTVARLHKVDATDLFEKPTYKVWIRSVEKHYPDNPGDGIIKTLLKWLTTGKDEGELAGKLLAAMKTPDLATGEITPGTKMAWKTYEYHLASWKGKNSDEVFDLLKLNTFKRGDPLNQPILSTWVDFVRRNNDDVTSAVYSKMEAIYGEEEAAGKTLQVLENFKEQHLPLIGKPLTVKPIE